MCGALPLANLTSLPTLAVATAGITISSPFPAKAVKSALMQHPAHGEDGSIFDGSRLFSSAGAPVGPVCAKAAALIHAARRGGVQHGVAHISAGHRAKLICQLSWYCECGQGNTTHWRCGFHSALWPQGVVHLPAWRVGVNNQLCCHRDPLHNSLRSVVSRTRAVCCVVFLADSLAIGKKKRLASHPESTATASPELCRGSTAIKLLLKVYLQQRHHHL